MRSSRWKSGPSKGQRPLDSECCVATGDSGREAYTAIAWGVGLSHERSYVAGAEGFHSLEGNMCGTAMRGADALPGSKATSRAQGSHRNLGYLASGRQDLRERDGPHREGEEPKPMMHGHEKSDPAIVAVKPANKAEQPTAEASAGASAAELVEPRAGTKGNADQQSTCRTQSRVSVTQALDRIRRVAGPTARFAVTHPRWEKLWGGRRRLWHLHRPYELMEVAPWPKSMISAAAWPRLIRSRPWWWSSSEQDELASERRCSRRRAPAVEETGAGCDGPVAIDRAVAERSGACWPADQPDRVGL